MFEMFTLQIRQIWIGTSTNWTHRLINYEIEGALFQQSVLLRDLSELPTLPTEILIPGGKRADLIKNAYDFMKPESRIVLRQKMEYFIAVAHLHLETVKDYKKEKWFWYFLERIFFREVLCLVMMNIIDYLSCFMLQ